MENLGIDLKLIIAQIVSFAIFYFVFRQFVSAPLLKYLKRQKEQEELREKLAEELEERQAKLEEKDREMDKQRKKALQEAIDQGKRDAEQVKQELMADAKKQAASIVADAKSQLAEEKDRMYEDMRKKVAVVSTMLVEKALQDYLTPEAKKAVTKHIIDNVPETKIEN